MKNFKDLKYWLWVTIWNVSFVSRIRYNTNLIIHQINEFVKVLTYVSEVQSSYLAITEQIFR